MNQITCGLMKLYRETSSDDQQTWTLSKTPLWVQLITAGLAGAVLGALVGLAWFYLG